jgi:hypothetical protein
MGANFQRALADLEQQIANTARQRDGLNVRLAQLQAAKIGLQNAIGQQMQAEIQWTNLVKTVIFNCAREQPMSAVQVRDTLQTWGYSFDGIQNPLSFINTCLQRLAQQGEITRSDVGRPFRFSCQE